MINKYKIVTVIALFFVLFHGSASGVTESINMTRDNKICENKIIIGLRGDYTNLTVEETWDLLNSTSNGIQIPIDVRRDNEWISEHIDTPNPEYARHWPNLQNGENLDDFIDLFDGKEVIIYCRSAVRSYKAIMILIENGFTGTLYNMIGGINEWKNQLYPVKPNEAPEKSTMNGPVNGNLETRYDFTFVTNDPDHDDIYLLVNWSDGTNVVWLGPFASGEEVTLNHTWAEKGTYKIKSIASDRYGNESEEATYSITFPRDKIVTNPLARILLDILQLLKRLSSICKTDI
jgi:rhodanese-related sulfurtransferase